MKKLFILLVILLANLSFSFDIKVIQTGSLTFKDDLLRKNTCMLRPIDLPFNEQFYQKHRNIDAVATMTTLNTDDHIAFQFYYHIECSQVSCILDFRLQRITPELWDNFNYEIRVDYIVGFNLKTYSFNMTQKRTSFMTNAFKSYDENNKLEQISNQNGEWSLYLIPNGFNDVSMTGKIKTLAIPRTNSFVIAHQNAGEIEWSLGKNFILYKALLLPTNYFQQNGCDLNLQTQQCASFQWLKGFFGTRENQIQIDQGEGEQAVSFFLPYKPAQKYIDIRQTVAINKNARLIEAERMQVGFAAVIVFFIVLEIVYLFYKKKYLKNRKTNSGPDLLINFEPPTVIISTQETNPPMQTDGTERELKEQELAKQSTV